jgi:hypothetical protein
MYSLNGLVSDVERAVSVEMNFLTNTLISYIIRGYYNICKLEIYMVLEALKKKYLGEILLEEKHVTKEQLEESLKESIENKEQLGQVLLRKGYITEDNLLNSLSISLGIEYRRLSNIKLFSPS